MRTQKEFFIHPIILVASYLLIYVGNEKISFPMFLAIPLFLASMRINDASSILVPITGALGLLINILRVFKIKFISKNRLFVTLGVVLLLVSIVFYYIGSGEKYTVSKSISFILPEFILVVSFAEAIWICYKDFVKAK